MGSSSPNRDEHNKYLKPSPSKLKWNNHNATVPVGYIVSTPNDELKGGCPHRYYRDFPKVCQVQIYTTQEKVTIGTKNIDGLHNNRCVCLFQVGIFKFQPLVFGAADSDKNHRCLIFLEQVPAISHTEGHFLSTS